MKTVEQTKNLRDLVTSLFAKGAFDEGFKKLDEDNQVPKVVLLECLGNMYFYRRELQSAIEKYEAAISSDPTYMIARYQYLVGTQDERKNDLVSAFKRYQAAIDIEPTFLDPYVELGGLLVKVGDLKGAAQCYRDAIKLAPSDPANYHNLKSVLAKLVAAEPGKYEVEMTEVDAAYGQLAKSDISLPPKSYQW